MRRTRRQWVTLGVGAVVLAALCVVAAFWQWNRYADRADQIALVEANWSAEPVPLTEFLGGPGDVLDEGDVWRHAVVVGEYVPEATVLLRNRPVDGTPGFHVLVPLRTELGGQEVVLIVDRGFVPVGTSASGPADLPAPPSGEVEVTVTLRADEPASDRGAPTGQVQRINTAQVLATGAEGDAWADGATVGAYGQARDEDPAPAQGLVPVPRPSTDPGSHLSYTLQWGIFALGALGGYVLLWRRERLVDTVTAGELLAADDPSSGSRPKTKRRRAGRDGLDEELEDALFDEGPRADKRPQASQAREISSA